MYDELVKQCRDCLDSLCGDCKYKRLQKPGNFVPCMNALLREAADAIEELSMKLHGDEAAIAGMQREIERMVVYGNKPRWIPVTERLPSDFVSVQAHMTDAGNFPPVREAYVVNKNWFFPALKEFHPVDMWKRFDKPPKEE